MDGHGLLLGCVYFAGRYPGGGIILRLVWMWKVEEHSGHSGIWAEYERNHNMEARRHLELRCCLAIVTVVMHLRKSFYHAMPLLNHERHTPCRLLRTTAMPKPAFVL